ncbi:uncharacterized protein LOC141631821 [Silene latifolia]|uniref:uncharacterized protein LOC141631821 n=1 Tax=Silene latifolia TaxID=37657 RepID=UPI003D773A98
MLLGSKTSTTKVNKFIVKQGNICTDAHKSILLSPVTKDEVKEVVFHIPDDKAPGPDGYSSKFFKDSWDIVGEEVTDAILNFFNSGLILKQINAIIVTLIPKITRPTSVLQYRPIACCNVIYKCIFKILCNRLARILSDLIAQNQGGFIQGRSIMENILICQDIIRLYERKAVSPRCLFKMDLQKAYDTVEWEFLDQMLSALNFPEQFKGWIMQCVTTASYSLNLNDDLLLFCKGDCSSILTILRSFATFSKASGLNMSKGKSNAYFNGVKAELKQDILRISVSSYYLFGVINRIEAICRNFLWDGGVDYLRSPLVSWEKICRPKSEGGLGLNCAIDWNKAAVGKLVWWLATKPDHLWVRWVNTVYIKGKPWLDYSPSSNSSWSWRKICQIKSLYQESYQQNIWTMDIGKGYSIAKGYDFIRNKGGRVQWHSLIWTKYTSPKHSFIAWIYFHKAFKTNFKMHKFGIGDDDTCTICGMDSETESHLFFECEYSSRIIALIGNQIREIIPANNHTEWRKRLSGSGIRREVINALVNASIYAIWRQRNQCKHDLVLLKPEKVTNGIINEVTNRTLSFQEQLGRRDRELIERLQAYNG